MSALKPDEVNKHDLGTSLLPWKALHVDEIAIGARAGVTGNKLVIGTAARLNADASDKVNVQIYGDLSVFGSQTVISSTTLEIKDLNITVAKDAEDSAAANGAGLVVAGASASLLYSHDPSQWELNKQLEVTGHVLPQATATYDLGSTSLGWNDLHLDAEGVINFDAGNMTVSHSAGLLSIAGGPTRVTKLEIDTANDHIDVDTDMTLTASAGIKLDATDDIDLSADGGDITFSDGDTSKLAFDMAGTEDAVVIKNGTDGDDLIFKLDAGATEIMRLDDSAGSLLMSGTKKIEFGTSGTFVHQSADGKLKLSSDGSTSDAIIIHASNALGGIDIDAGNGGISITSPVVDIDAATAVRVSNDLELDSDSAVIRLGADKDVTLTHHDDVGLLLNNDNKLMLGSTGSFIQETATGKILMSGSAAAADAVKLASSNAAGGVKIFTGTGGLDVDATSAGDGTGNGGVTVNAGAASTINVATSGADEVDLTLSVTGGGNSSLLLSSAGTGADSISISGGTGGSGGGVDIDADGALHLDSNTGINIGTFTDKPIDVDATTFDLDASAALTMTSTTMALDPSSTFDLNATGAATIDASTFSVGGGAGLSNGRTTGAITLKSTSADATIQTATSGKVHLNSVAAVDIDGPTGVTVDTTAAGADIVLDAQSGSVLIDGGEDVATAIKLDASHDDGGIVIESGTKGVDLDASGLVSIESSRDNPKAVEVVASAGGIDILATGAAGDDIDILATGSSVNIESTENDASAIKLDASHEAGGIVVESGTSGVNLDTTGQLALTSSKAAADAVVIEASNAGGGIDLSVDGVVVSVDADSVDISQDVNISGATPTLTIGRGNQAEEDSAIIFSGHQKTFHVGLDDSADKLSIGLGSTLGTNANMTLESETQDVTFGGDIEVQGGKITLSNGAIISSETEHQLILTETLVKTSGNLEVTGNLTVQGETTTVNTATLDVEDYNITLNKGGEAATAAGAGLDFEEDGSITGYIRVDDQDRTNLDLKAPGGSELKLDINDDSTFIIGAGLTISGASAINQDLTTGASVTFNSVDADGGVTVDNLRLDDRSLILSSGNLELKASAADGNVILDANGGTLSFKDAGVALLSVVNSDQHVVLQPVQSDKDIIFKEDGGTEIARFDSSEASLLMASGKKIQWGDAAEAIYADGTDIYFEVGALGDINIPADIGMTFGDDGEKIEGDGIDLTIASSNDLNLTATTNINVPENVGMTFGDDGEKISGNGTDLTIASSNDLNLTATTNINIPANVGLTFGDDGEKIEGDGTNLTVASSGDIILNPTSAVLPGADSADDLGADGTAWRKLYVDDIDLNGQGSIILDADADTSIRASEDDVISFKVGDADKLHLKAATLQPNNSSSLTLGTAAKSFSNLFLADAQSVSFQDNSNAQNVTLTHVRDKGLTLKNLKTTNADGVILTLQTGDTQIAANDVLGSLEFQAPNESEGTDAIEVAAAISAVAEGNFSSTSNATKLSFKTGFSEVAAEKMALSSEGDLSLVTDGTSIKFGADSDVTLLHVHETGLRLNGTRKLLFNDNDVHISSDADGHINVQADTQVSLNINGNDELTITESTATFGTNLVIPNAGQIGSVADNDAITISGDAQCEVKVTSEKASTSSTLGALVVAGGVGVAGRLNVATQANVGSVELNAKTITMTGTDNGDGNTDDDATFEVDANGALTITTVDANAAAADMSLIADGAFNVDAVGAITIDSDAGATLGATTFNINADGTDGTGGINITCDDTTNGIDICTDLSGVPVNIGHSTSQTTVGDNLKVNGNTQVVGTFYVGDDGTGNTDDYILRVTNPVNDSNGRLDFKGGTFSISGSISSSGTEVSITDPLIKLASGGPAPLGVGNQDLGFYAKDASNNFLGLIYDYSASCWKLHQDLTTEANEAADGKFNFDQGKGSALELGNITIKGKVTHAVTESTEAAYVVDSAQDDYIINASHQVTLLGADVAAPAGRELVIINNTDGFITVTTNNTSKLYVDGSETGVSSDFSLAARKTLKIVGVGGHWYAV